MANIRNCKKCGKLFNYVGGSKLCQECREDLEKQFQTVKDYIREHPGVGIQEVSEACEVEVSQIKTWLREERLELTSGSPLALACESCGVSILKGRYCDKCKLDLANGLQNILKAGQPAPAPERAKSGNSASKGMHFL